MRRRNHASRTARKQTRQKLTENSREHRGENRRNLGHKLSRSQKTIDVKHLRTPMKPLRPRTATDRADRGKRRPPANKRRHCSKPATTGNKRCESPLSRLPGQCWKIPEARQSMPTPKTPGKAPTSSDAKTGSNGPSRETLPRRATLSLPLRFSFSW